MTWNLSDTKKIELRLSQGQSAGMLKEWLYPLKPMIISRHTGTSNIYTFNSILIYFSGKQMVFK